MAKKTITQAGKRKDPKGGLTAAGRKYFAQKDGAHLKPGVTGAADTPEKVKRKGSFLRRHYANPRGPVVKDGQPTRLALAAHAWGAGAEIHGRCAEVGGEGDGAVGEVCEGEGREETS